MKKALKKTSRNLSREEARGFLEKIADIYNNRCKTFSRFEEWAERYIEDRRHKEWRRNYLSNVLGYLRNRNNGHSRIYGIDNLIIEDILNATIPEEVS